MSYRRLLGGLLLLVIFLACALSPMQTDTWWQLRAGRDMWSTGHVLLTDYYSHTAYGSFWPNHEWLAEVVFYAVYRLGGLPLLSLFSAAVIASAWAMVWHFTPGSERSRFVLLAAALPTASMHWEPRPHAFSFVFMMMTVALIIRRRYIWLPLVFWIWANCHGGVLFGLILVAAAMVEEAVDRAIDWKRALGVVVLCAAAMMMTPLGTSFWSEMASSIGRIHQYPLDEWRRPELLDVRLVPYWLGVGAFGALLVWRGRELMKPANRTTRLFAVCAAAALPFSITAVRGVGPFLMLALPAVAGLWQMGSRPVGPVDHGEEARALNAALLSAASLLVAIALAYAYAHGIDRLRWAPLPPGSIQALRECPGNLYNRYDEGGYLAWFAPDRRVFLDGRQDPYPASLVLEQIAVETSGEYGRTFAKHDIECAYLPAVSPVLPRLRAAGWTALYEDREWAVFAKGKGPQR